MARECQICSKGGMLVRGRKKLRTRWNPTPKRRQKPNLQSVLVPQDISRQEYRAFVGKRVLMCMKCQKTMFKPTRRAKRAVV